MKKEIENLLLEVKFALEQSYDVVSYPADGTTLQDQAIAKIKD